MYDNTLDQIIVKLTSVNISWCDLITQSGIAALSQGCRKLKSFISKVKFYDNEKLQTYNYLQGCLHIGDEALYNLARFCSQLEVINVQGCRNIQDEGMAALCDGCPNIKYMCISNCPHLTDQSLVQDILSLKKI